jgi:hypothetical protein
VTVIGAACEYCPGKEARIAYLATELEQLHKEHTRLKIERDRLVKEGLRLLDRNIHLQREMEQLRDALRRFEDTRR